MPEIQIDSVRREMKVSVETKLETPLRVFVSSLTEVASPTDGVKVEKSDIDGIFVLTPKDNKDGRGSFKEITRSSTIKKLLGSDVGIEQINCANNIADVGRGFHAENEKKVCTVIEGKVCDVCVDVRPNSRTFGKVFSTILDAKNLKVLALVNGIAHGYFVIDSPASFVYAVSAEYPNLDPKESVMVRIDDPFVLAQLGGQLPIVGELNASSKDKGRGEGANVGRFLKEIFQYVDFSQYPWLKS